MIDTNLLKGKIKAKGMTQADIASALNLAETTINQKINNVRGFTLEETESVSRILNLSSDEILGIFLPKMLQNVTENVEGVSKNA